MGEIKRRNKRGENGESKSQTKKKKSQSANGGDGRSSSEAPRSNAPSDEGSSSDETLWQTFTRHPLIQVAPFVIASYGLYLLYYKLVLQRPDLLSTGTFGLINPRPAVSVHDERQLLIVGSISGGTAQVAADLRARLSLEIGHEVSDTHWHFVRDGTVSWFHGIRFLQPPAKEELGRSLRKLCAGGGNMNMGFHPASYRIPYGKCSYRKKWDKCWARECYTLIVKEWGCAMTGKCEINFRRTLHQVRNPLRTIESLVAKFCQGGMEGTVSPSFLAYASALFPGHDFSGDSCVEAAAFFVVEYSNAIEVARSRGEIFATYKVEKSTPCDVAHLAGLTEENSTVYHPNVEKVAVKCGEILGSATELIDNIEGRVNKGQVQLGWKDLRGGMHGSNRTEGSKDLENQVKLLYKTFGYDTEVEAEVGSSLPLDTA